MARKQNAVIDELTSTAMNLLYSGGYISNSKNNYSLLILC